MWTEALVRLKRRKLGYPAARFDELDIEGRIDDPRKRPASVKLKVLQALKVVAAGLAAGGKGFAEVETFASTFGTGTRKALDLYVPIRDTTLRELFVALDPQQLRQLNIRACKLARRRKQLALDSPLRVLAMDGKYTTTWLHDDPGAAVQYGQWDSSTGRAKVGTITCCDISTPARPCLDACPVPPHTNEMGAYVGALDDVLAAYGPGYFDMVTYDAGACSLANATATRKRGPHYAFCLRDNQPELCREAQRVLGNRPAGAAADTSVRFEGSHVVTRSVSLYDLPDGWLDWTHARTLVRIHCVREEKGGEARVTREDRYYVTSLPQASLTAAQWNELVRRRWSVENNNHNVWDRILEEDKRPWI
ncbi:MAG: transposase, partial [Deltaproteobacteria bacterium]|nr:transposase [Deltaproteobacteria bacterium]